jgi:hypothetical protein
MSYKTATVMRATLGWSSPRNSSGRADVFFAPNRFHLSCAEAPMVRFPLSGVLLVAVGLTGAACSEGPAKTEAQPAGYMDSAGAPLVPPDNPYTTSGTTATKQSESGYYPNADAPLVPPDTGNAGAGSTVKKQEKSGYFPEPDAPLVPKNTSGNQ